jgi:hypothetical protein
MRPEQADRFTGWSRALGTHNALSTRSHKWLRRSPSAGYLSIRTLDPLVVTQGFIVAASLQVLVCTSLSLRLTTL